MDMIELRRRVMLSMASGNKNLIYAKTVTMEKTATELDPVVINLPIMTSNYIILVVSVNYPSPPEAEKFIALMWEKKKIGDYNIMEGRVLRANGTVGNDNTQCAYNESDGTLSIGGHWGYFPLGAKYEIYCIQMK